MLLKILSILGIVLLCLLALLLVTLLLVLFWPVSYQGGGSARPGEYRAWFRFWWLFGLVRGGYAYPESKGLQVKVLWLTVYDSGGRQEKEELEDAPEGKGQSGQALSEQAVTKPKEQMLPEQAVAESEVQPLSEQVTAEVKEQIPPRQTEASDGDREAMPKDKDPLESQASTSSDSGEQSQDTGESSKADQYQPLPEKLSNLKEKLQIYLAIVRDKNNQGLVKHGLTRLGKILKSIRPRFFRAEALVGLGEPDLTGYVYGAYWAVKPFLGKKCQVAVTPDFDRRILEGEADLRGRIMAVMLVHHVLRVLLDRRLRRLIGQLKNISK
ncbi:MAG: DUF2953 domain-containing protein [Acetatifactor sp.]|nr:DUF2953 domain-containing protein [Acetatifactor sp.]